jgi:hypothetical protein
MEEEEKKEKEEKEKPEEEKPSSIMVYLPVLVFVVILAVGGFFLIKRSGQKASSTQSSEETLFEDEGIAEITSEILISDFSAGDSVTVEYVLLDRKGYVVIHGQVDGKPGEVLGYSELLDSGESENVVVELEREIEDGEIVFAFLHGDDGDGEFNFPGKDIPVTDEYGQIIMSMYRVGESEVSLEQATDSAELKE